MRRKKRNSYKFTEKNHSKRGIRSFVMALLSILIGISVVVISFQQAGNAGVYVGSAGLFSLGLSFVALIMGIRSLKEEDSYKIFPGLGTFFSAAAFICWLSMYGFGFYMSM